jgi:hypothetical protein
MLTEDHGCPSEDTDSKQNNLNLDMTGLGRGTKRI